MIKRFLQTISVPVFFIMLTPGLAIVALLYVIDGKITPTKILEKYFEWLDS